MGHFRFSSTSWWSQMREQLRVEKSAMKPFFFYLNAEEKAQHKYLCLNVRSATASKKKNKNVKQMRNTKLVINTTCSHVLVPNANRTIFILDTVVFSIRIIGILRMFMSVELVNVIVACEENDSYLKEKKNKRFKKTSQSRQKTGTKDRKMLSAQPM